MHTAGMLRRGCGGRTLIEALALAVVVAVALQISIPSLVGTWRSAELAGAAGRLRGLMFRCRAAAVTRQRATGLVFEREAGGSWRCFIAVDGDGDGIQRRDIARGIDSVESEVLRLDGRRAGLGILEHVPDPRGRGRLRGDLGDPVRAGRGDIITFTPRGHATPSSVYLTDHRSRMRVLRVYGSTGRVVGLRWQRGWQEWRRGLY